MSTNRKNRLTAALLGALATIGSLHAPLHAAEPAPSSDDTPAEIVRNDYADAPAKALAASATAAFERASASLREELAIDLALRLGTRTVPTVADVDAGN